MYDMFHFTIELARVNYQLLYPEPDFIPDLCVNAPVMVCGSYEGPTPTHALIQGTGVDGKEKTFDVKVTIIESTAPFLQLVSRHKLEYVIGQWWMENEKETGVVVNNFGPEKNKNKKKRKKKELRYEAVLASLTSYVPCIFTTMIGFSNSSRM